MLAAVMCGWLKPAKGGVSSALPVALTLQWDLYMPLVKILPVLSHGQQNI